MVRRRRRSYVAAMAYLDRNLGDKEEVLYRAQFHWLGYAQAWAALILLGVLLIGLVVFARMLIYRATTEMVVTDQRVAMKSGWLAIDVESLALEAVESVRIQESLLGRLLGFGKMTISGRGDLKIVFPAIRNPSAFAAALETARDANDAT
ncbi:MAG: PH domain-containing protein [Pseudomonadota bacterium]